MGTRSNRRFIVDSCYHSLNTTVDHNMAVVVVRSKAATHDRSRSEYYVTAHTFRIRSCSSRSYYFEDMPSFGCNRTVSAIHNSSHCCNLTAAHHKRTTAAQAVTTMSCSPIAAIQSIIIKPLTE